jgi:hypothetical protein
MLLRLAGPKGVSEMANEGTEIDGIMVPPEWTHRAERAAYAHAINSGLPKEDAAFVAATIRVVREARRFAPLPEKPLCISCGEPATEKAGKGGGTGSDLCARCWRDEFSDPAEGIALTAAVPPAAIAISAIPALRHASAATRWKRAEGLWSLPVRESVEQSAW